jgi:hypothetical protein
MLDLWSYETIMTTNTSFTGGFFNNFNPHKRFFQKKAQIRQISMMNFFKSSDFDDKFQ